MNGADLKARFKAPRRRVAILLDGGLLAEHEAVSAQLADAMAARTSLAGSPGADELARKVQDLEAQMREASVTFELVGLGSNAFEELANRHKDQDGTLNVSSWTKDLVGACLRYPKDIDLDWLFETLTQGQVGELLAAASAASANNDRVPFNQLASAQTRG